MARARTSWKPGQSGNPSGRPASALSRYRQMLADNGPELIGRMIELARAPDPETALPALRWCCDRLAGPMKARAEPIALPMEGSAAEQTKSVLAAVAAGRVTPEEGLTLLNALRAAAEVAEVPALKAELAELKEKMG